MEKSDVDAVVEIIQLHDPFDGKCAKRYFSQYFSSPSRIESPHEKHYVIIKAETRKILGVSGHTPDQYETPGVYWLGWTYVAPNFQRQGLGSELLDHVIKQVGMLKARKLYLDTSSDPKYTFAMSLWKRFGFCLEGKLKDYYRNGEDYLILVYNYE